MQTMKEVLISFKGKKLDVTFNDGVIKMSVKVAASTPASYPSYSIDEVGTDVFRMTHKGSEKAGGVSRYYRIDKVLEIGPIKS